MNPVIRAKGLQKSYGGHRVVDGLDLSIGKGECFGLLGPNGAGKTSTLRMLLGLITPDAGTAMLLDLPVPQAAREAPDAGTRAGERPRCHLPRRADHRPRSAGAPADLAASARTHAAGQDPVARDALHGRSRTPVPPPRGIGQRETDQPGIAARIDRAEHLATGGGSVRRDFRAVGGYTCGKILAALRSQRRAGICYVKVARPLVAHLQKKSALRYLHRSANLEDVFLKLAGREMRE
jgi:energy-coupling factor transporter ATP-binding protein EcfA2